MALSDNVALSVCSRVVCFLGAFHCGRENRRFSAVLRLLRGGIFWKGGPRKGRFLFKGWLDQALEILNEI